MIKKILVIDNPEGPGVRRYVEALREAGHDVEGCFDNVEETIKYLESKPWDVVVVEPVLFLYGTSTDWIRVARALRKTGAQIIILTDSERFLDGATVLIKPIALIELTETVEK